jgi:hypothetical protein
VPEAARLDLPRDPEASVWDEFRRLAAVTALKRAADGEFFSGHWWRGPLLYALVTHYRPRHVLEFGTGRGYGAVCMAKAAVDGGFDCTVWTIDSIPPETKQEWPIDEGRGPEVRYLALAEVWSRHVPEAARARIRCLTGDSTRVMAEWSARGRPRVQLSFLDGGHDYATVKHDFIAALGVADAHGTFVFDDYTDRPDYGVRRLIDAEIRPRVPAAAIEILDAYLDDRLPGGRRVRHQLALVRGEYLGAAPLSLFYSSRALRGARARVALRRAVSRCRRLAAGVLGVLR